MLRIDLPGWHAQTRDATTGKLLSKPIVFAVLFIAPTGDGRAGAALIPYVDNDGELCGWMNARVVRAPDA